MQIKKLIPSLTQQWKEIYERERPGLSPNAISGAELADYVRTRFDAEPVTDEAYLNAVRTDVRNDTFFCGKLNGAEPCPAAFRLKDGSFVGLDLVSGWFFAEDDAVRDELTAVKGLDEDDLDNVVRTVDYLRCKALMESPVEKKRAKRRLAQKRFGNRNELKE